MVSSLSFVSLNSGVSGQIAQVLCDEKYPKCPITQEALLSIIDAISNYHEEGKVFYPEIFLTTDVEALFKAVPTSTIIKLGEKPLHKDSFRVALKTSVPLATDGWSVFIERTLTKLQFGLVRSGDSILALPMKEILFSEDSRVGGDGLGRRGLSDRRAGSGGGPPSLRGDRARVVARRVAA